jgi:hypothetical protein
MGNRSEAICKVMRAYVRINYVLYLIVYFEQDSQAITETLCQKTSSCNSIPTLSQFPNSLRINKLSVLVPKGPDLGRNLA